ncbi:hypothetical protein [Oceaniferula spumae]
MKKLLLSILGCGVLASCASSSGVVPMGQDTYMVARSLKSIRGDSGRVKAEAIREANEFCLKQGKVMKIIDTNQKDMQPFRSDAQAEIQFMCLDPNDPRLK